MFCSVSSNILCKNLPLKVSVLLFSQTEKKFSLYKNEIRFELFPSKSRLGHERHTTDTDSVQKGWILWLYSCCKAFYLPDFCVLGACRLRTTWTQLDCLLFVFPQLLLHCSVSVPVHSALRSLLPFPRPNAHNQMVRPTECPCSSRPSLVFSHGVWVRRLWLSVLEISAISSRQ